MARSMFRFGLVTLNLLGLVASFRDDVVRVVVREDGVLAEENREAHGASKDLVEVHTSLIDLEEVCREAKL